MKWILIFLSLTAAACQSTEPEYERSGRYYTIVCQNTWNQCYYRAQNRCMNYGYRIINSVEGEKTGGVYGRYREYTLNIQCK